MIILLNIFLTIIILAFCPFLALWALIGRHGFAHRLGFLPKNDDRPIWIHSASVGEAGVAVVLRDILHTISPETPVIITSTTKMGKRRLEKILSHPDRAAILPFDFFIFITLAMSRVNPSALIIVETELWPNLITIAKKRGIPIIMANGKMSENTKNWSRVFGSGFRKVTSSIDIFLMKSNYDAENLYISGVEKDKIYTLGNLKFSAFPENIEKIDKLDNPTIVFGSIRPKEYAGIIDVCKNLQQTNKKSKILLAPRHLNTINQLTKVLEKHNVPYRTRRNNDENIENIYLDPDKIKQALLNIITNAIDFTPVGGEIRIVTENFPRKRKPSSIRLRISDNGPGISPGIIDKIFDPYFTTKRHGNMRNGTGLGLFIAYRDLQDHGGTIEAQSEEDNGTTFILTLPYRAGSEKGGADGRNKNVN